MNNKLYNYKISNLVKVVDGDTIDVNVDLGFEVSKKVRCRLARINAPEIGTDEGKVFKQKLIDKLTVATPVSLESLQYDKYGRSVAEIMLSDNTMLSDYMISLGCPLYK